MSAALVRDPRLFGLREESRAVDPRAGRDRRASASGSRRCWCRPRRSSRCKRGAKVSAERKFFPGYVLVKMDLSDETWHLVKNTPKVTGFLGGRGRPVPISEAEAGRIMRQVQEGIERPKPSITFEIGEQVRVCRRTLHLVQRLCRRSRRGEGAAQGGGVDLRPRDAGRARIFAGGEGLIGRSRASGTTERGKRRAPIEEKHGEEDCRLHQVAGSRGQGQSLAADRPRPGPARPQHHGVLQGVQRRRRRTWSRACRCRW